MIDLPYSGGFTPHVKQAIWIIEQLGIYGLGGSDGCECMKFSIQGVNVAIACHKSEHTVRIWANGIRRHSELIEVAKVVVPKLGLGYTVRFCEYIADHQYRDASVPFSSPIITWVKDKPRCCYCGAFREDKEDYLCDEHKNDLKARWSYPIELVGWKL